MSSCSSATPKMSAQEMATLIKKSPPGPWPQGWAGWENVREAHVLLLNEFIKDIPPYPEGRYKGRGVVSSVNAKPGWSSGKNLNHGYFPGAYVMVNELRRLGCELPVTFAHLGPMEWDHNLSRIVSPLGVDVIDLRERNKAEPMRILAGWESKVYSILQAPYEQVLFLDADNIPLKDPTYLFDSPHLKHYGAILWPDVPPYDRDEWLPPAVWLNMGLPVGDTQAAESGQLLIDKRACWRELMVCKWLNEHSDYVYNWLFGDKDTFVMAWHKIHHTNNGHGKLQYHMVNRSPGGNHGSLIQHWVDGSPLFQHGTRNKPTAQGYPHPDAVLPRTHCEKHLQTLRSVWNGRLWQNDTPTEQERLLMSDLMSRIYLYERVKMDKRPMRFLEDHRIGRGLAGLETDWNVFSIDGRHTLVISGMNGTPTCLLDYHNEEGVWRGRWLQHERCEVVLSPLTEGTL